MVQKTVVNKALATGLPGEFFTDEPQRSQGKILSSTDASLNVMGVVVKQSNNTSEIVGVDLAGAFAGILSTPKSLYREGLNDLTLIPNGQQVEVIQQGYVTVVLPAAANIGDWVYYSDTDGTYETQAPGAAPSVGFSRLPGGTVQIFKVESAGVGVIYLDSAGDQTVGA